MVRAVESLRDLPTTFTSCEIVTIITVATIIVTIMTIVTITTINGLAVRHVNPQSRCRSTLAPACRT